MRCFLVSWLVLCVVGTSTFARAYELKEPTSGQFVRWRQATVELHVSDGHHGSVDAEMVRSSLEMATEAWRGIHGSPDVVIAFDGPDEPDPYDRINSVHVLRHWPEYLGETLAVTVSTYDYGGRLLDTDILINAEMPFDILDEAQPARRFDLPSVLTHEVGHVLGLDESDIPEATMFGHLRRGQVFQRTLHIDDENGVMALYGATPMVEPAGCDAAGRPTSWLLVGIWLLLLLPRRESAFAPVRRRSSRRDSRMH